MPPVLSKLPVMMSEEDVIDKRYENCVIYKLVHKEDEDAYEKYVGHTIQSLTRRMFNHKSTCYNQNRKDYELKLYKYIRENGGIDMWEIVKIIDYPCKNEIEAGKKEGEYIISLKCSLNDKLAGRDKNQYYCDNKDKIRKKQNEYRKINPELASQRDKMYKIKHIEKIKEREKQNIKCDNCGSIVTIYKLNRHKKTTKCLEHNAL